MGNATRRLTCGFVNRFDNDAMLSGICRGTEPQGRYRALGRALFIGLLASFMSLSLASNSFAWKNSEMNLKLYAHNQIKDWDQFICFVDLIEAESSWDYKAKNGSHYGLGQMRSTWYKDLTPRQQIKAHLRYIDHRYKGDICRAYRHWVLVGWH
jgi:hypothetical protein